MVFDSTHDRLEEQDEIVAELKRGMLLTKQQFHEYDQTLKEAMDLLFQHDGDIASLKDTVAQLQEGQVGLQRGQAHLQQQVNEIRP